MKPPVPLLDLIEGLIDINTPYMGTDQQYRLGSALMANIILYLQELQELKRPKLIAEHPLMSLSYCPHGTPHCYPCDKCDQEQGRDSHGML